MLVGLTLLCHPQLEDGQTPYSGSKLTLRLSTHVYLELRGVLS